MEQESRKARRFAVQLPCTISNSGEKEEATVLNLSAQGCAMTTEKIPEVSTYLSLRIDPVNGAAPIDIELAGVRWIADYRCGLEFIRISPDSMERLRSFMRLLESTP